MINAITVDDEPPALRVLENFCSKVEFIDLQKTFTRPQEAIKHLRKFPVDLLFLDIQMPSLSGIEFYKSVQQETMVIFTTAFSEYAVEGFNVSAVDYLLKPFTFERFTKAVEKAKEFYQLRHHAEASRQEYLFVRADYSLIKIPLAEILYIEGLDDYIKIHFSEKKPIVARMTLKSLQEKLDRKEFVRVHRSFIVPLKKVESIRNKMVFIGSREIPIGTSYEEDFLKMVGKEK